MGASANRIVGGAVLVTLLAGIGITQLDEAMLIPAFAGGLAVVLLLRAWLSLRPVLRGVDFLVVAGTTMLFVSLVRFSDRDPTGSSLGMQAVFELGLQCAALFALVSSLRTGSRLIQARTQLAWLAVAGLGAVTAFWSPSVLLSLSKGAQLAVLTVAAPFVAAQFPSRRALVLFVSYLAATVFAGIVAYQAAFFGIGSLRPEGVDGRHELSLLDLHPLATAGLFGLLCVLLLASSPRWPQLLLAAGFAVTCFLTQERVPNAALAATVVALVLARAWSARRGRLATLLIVTATIALLAVGVAAIGNQLVSSPGQVTKALTPQYFSTLNGRIPLWEATIGSYASPSTGVGAFLFGHGFGSFRYFGLDVFAFAGEAHNAALQVLYELGLVGVLIWLIAVFALGARIALTTPRRPGRLVAVLPFIYVLMIELTDSALADSRSFLLVLLLLYCFAPGAEAREPAPVEARQRARPPALPAAAGARPRPGSGPGPAEHLAPAP